MKEANTNINNSQRIFAENFTSEYYTRNVLKGVPTAVTYNADGTGTFNGSAKLYGKKSFSGTISIRVRFKLNSIGVNQALYDNQGSNSDGTGIFYINSSNVVSKLGTGGTIYLNGITTSLTVTTNTWFEAVLSGVTVTKGTGTYLSCIGGLASAAINYNLYGILDLVEIYQGTLSASEILNMYRTRTYKELPANTSEQLGSELIANGTFESDITDWVNDNCTTFERNTVSPISGVADLHFVTDANFWHGARGKINTSCAAGDVFKVSITHRTTSGLTIQMWIGNNTLGSSATYSNTTAIGSLTNTTTTVYLTCSALVASPYLVIITNSAAIRECWIDNISIKKVLQPQITTLLDWQPKAGYAIDKTNKCTLTDTSMSYERRGNSYWGKLDGTAKYVDISGITIGANNLLILFWVNIKTLTNQLLLFQKVSAGNSMYLMTSTTNNRYTISNDSGVTTAISANSSWKLNKYQCLAIYRKNNIASFYIGDITNSMALSGSANQSIGTANTNDTGARIGTSVSFQINGNVGRMMIYQFQSNDDTFALQLAEQYRTNSRKDL